jgi:hypothetical protein
LQAAHIKIDGIDIDGGTDIGAPLADEDLILIDDGVGGTNRKCAMRRIKTYAEGIKLDDLSAPEDNTDLDVSITSHGLCPKAPNDRDKFLRGDGNWAAISFVSLILLTGMELITIVSAVPLAAVPTNQDLILNTNTANITLQSGIIVT